FPEPSPPPLHSTLLVSARPFSTKRHGKGGAAVRGDARRWRWQQGATRGWAAKGAGSTAESGRGDTSLLEGPRLYHRRPRHPGTHGHGDPGYFVELQAHGKEEVGYACTGVILFCEVGFVYIITSKACFEEISDPEYINVFFVDGNNTLVEPDNFVIFEHFVGISCPLNLATDDRVVAVKCDNNMVTREQVVYTICLEDFGSNAVVTSGIVGKTEELFFYHNCRARRYTEYGGPVFDDKHNFVGLCYDRPCGILAALTVKSIEDSLSEHYNIANTGMDEIVQQIYAINMSRDDRASHGTHSNSTGCAGGAQAPPSQWSMENSERKNMGYWRSEDMSSPSQTRLAHPPRSKRPFLESSSDNSRGKRRKSNYIKPHHAQLKIASDTVFYLYPFCEGLQRFCTEHKIKLSKIDHIFLTRVCSETAGGLPGLVLTLAGIGDEGISMNIWGPSDLDFLAGAMRSLFPNRAMLHTHSFRVEGNVSSSQSKDSVVILDDEVVRISAIFVKPRYESEANSLEDVDLKPGDTAIVYACELPEIKGNFDPAKAAALGLKPGPKYRELQLGNSVQSDQFDKMVHLNDVLGPSIPGPTVILVDCPTQNHMQQLFSLQALSCFYENSSDQIECGKKVNCIIHLSPSSVTKSVDYQSWMKKFGATHHIMAGHEIKNMEIPILKGSARISSRLNFICPQLFPSSGFWPVETANGGTEKNMYTSLETCESVPALNLLKFHLRPYAQLGLDRASSPSLFTYEDIVEELISEIPEVREVPEHVCKFWHHNPDDKSTLAPVGSMLMVEEPWICFFFLSLVGRDGDCLVSCSISNPDKFTDVMLGDEEPLPLDGNPHPVHGPIIPGNQNIPIDWLNELGNGLDFGNFGQNGNADEDDDDGPPPGFGGGPGHHGGGNGGNNDDDNGNGGNGGQGNHPGDEMGENEDPMQEDAPPTVRCHSAAATSTLC
ncbi:hypothetical protein EJB05_32742, partial [Eragrostis curvula]